MGKGKSGEWERKELGQIKHTPVYLARKCPSKYNSLL